MIAADLGGQALERAELYAQERASREGLDRILAVAPRLPAGRDSAPTRSQGRSVSRPFARSAVTQPRCGRRSTTSSSSSPGATHPPQKLPSGTQVEFADFPGLLERDDGLAVDVRARRPGAGISRRRAQPRSRPRHSLVAAAADRDRGPVRADPDVAVGARDRRAVAGGDRARAAASPIKPAWRSSRQNAAGRRRRRGCCRP